MCCLLPTVTGNLHYVYDHFDVVGPVCSIGSSRLGRSPQAREEKKIALPHGPPYLD